ncbi:Hsp20/alpha crystallin family protein [Capillibacterium thermochitinicola]|uniref:Hsp20/alpha crystallin family protein n=1 Tax=Capillibacterium thermochitinicola TaxID=2699427 RepID=A0A8J6I1P2_9FIRM|nr:Hsp20/alpha crystallin family protein [Capillibacterium thermochitinicola]MBA2132749.1 Hsp20/alpha crystallin family protein [Capillibacterium thermochitinicola]
MESRNWLSPINNDFWGERFFNHLLPRSFGEFFRGASFGPSVDLKETDQEIILEADLPGMNRDDLEITVDHNQIILKGEMKRNETKEERGYHLTERRYGTFYRAIQLPVEVKAEQASAKYRNGVLEVRVPKADSAKNRGYKLKIEGDDYPVQ